MLNLGAPLTYSLTNNKNEYQHRISSTSNTNVTSILKFEGAQFKKVSGAVSKQGRISKKIGFPIFLAQGKNPTSMQVEIKKWL